jgi:SAM-dependent methyltransferase
MRKNPPELYGVEYLKRPHFQGSRWEDNGRFYGAAVAVHRFLNEFGGDSVLEVGCGRGYVVRHLRNLGRRADGIEYSPAAAEFSVCDALLGDVTRLLPLPDASYDLVICHGVLCHLPPALVARALRELARVSRRWLWVNMLVDDPNGEEPHHLCVREPVWWRPRFAVAGWNEIAPELAGLTEFNGMDGRWSSLWEKAESDRPAALVTRGPGSASHSSRVVEALTFGADSLLDLGTRLGAHTRDLPIPKRLYVDLEELPGRPDPFLRADALRVREWTRPGEFEVVTCLDFIEHLEKADGERLIADLEELAGRRVIYFTPLGPLWLDLEPGPRGHHSGWLPEEFISRGYQVWSWPEFHASIPHGAFWAWKTLSGPEVSASELALALSAQPEAELE